MIELAKVGRLRGRWWLVVVLAWTVLAAVIGVRFRSGATDDIFITYTYAQHLADGDGLVFNRGERVFGVSDPGVALALGAAHVVTRVPISMLGTLLTAGALLGIAMLLLRETMRAGRPLAGVVAGSLLVGSADLWTGQGSGPLPALALLLLAAVLVRDEGKSVLAGIVAGCAVVCRPDALAGVAVLGLLLIVERRRFPLRFALAALGVIAAGAIAATAWFGSPLPATLHVKQQLAALNPEQSSPAAFWRSAVWLFTRGLGPWTALLFGILGAVGAVVIALQQGRPIRLRRLVIATGAVMAVAYTMLGAGFFAWYTAPAVVALLTGVGETVGWSWQVLRRQPRPRMAAGLAFVVVALAIAVGVGWVGGLTAWWRDGDAGDWRRFAYTAAGRWIHDHSAPSESIAFNEVGLLGYWSDRPMLDVVGLVTPSSRPFSRVGDFLGAFLVRPSTFVVWHTFDAYGGGGGLTTRPWFATAYGEVARFDSAELHGSILVYRRKPGSRVPPPRSAPFDRARALLDGPTPER
jgi:hypothetical protein